MAFIVIRLETDYIYVSMCTIVVKPNVISIKYKPPMNILHRGCSYHTYFTINLYMYYL